MPGGQARGAPRRSSASRRRRVADLRRRALPRGPNASRRSRPGSPRSSSATTTPERPTARRLAPVDLIERTTGGIRWLPEAGVRRVILAPSYFSRPYNFLMSASDWRFFGYPVVGRGARGRSIRSRRRSRSSGSIGRSATRPGCGSSSCSPGGTSTSPRSPSSSSCPSRRSSTTSPCSARPGW